MTRALLVSVTWVLATVATARGQVSSPDRDPKEVARTFVDAGLLAQKSGDYATAIDLYQKANAIAPHPTLLFNIAQAHRLSSIAARDGDPAAATSHRDAAREHYRAFLDQAPEGDLEVTARGWLAKLDQQWADEHPAEEAARRALEAQQRETAIEAEQARLMEEGRRRTARDRLERERIGAAVSRTRTDSDRSKGRTVKITGLAALGSGLVAVGVGTYFGLEARGLASELHAEDVFDPARIEEGNQAERYAVIAWATGGALLVGGAITYWIGRGIGARAEGVTVGVGPSLEGGAALVVHGGF